MLSPHDELPPPPRVRIERSSLPNVIVLLFGTIFITYAAVGLYRWASEPIALTAPPSTSGPVASPVLFPPELRQMAVAVSTSLAPSPTPLPPTPTYAMLPTPAPPDVCVTTTPTGEICTQPEPPAPSPTPIPPCPVEPGNPCIHTGGPVRWASPTPTYTAGDGGSS